MVMLTINNKEVEGNEGDTILEVAEAADIYIPTLCNHPQLPPFGSCRMCLVKVQDMQNYVPACTTPIDEGMVVYTDIEELKRLKRNILELILCDHPSACIVCDDRELCFKYHKDPEKAGTTTGCRFCPNKDDCELYEIADHLDIKDLRLEVRYKELPIHRDDFFIERNYNLCILCGRCVRECREIRGVSAVAFTERSHKATVGTAFDKPLIESECIFCGACIDVCPTGALSEKALKWGGKAEKITSTTCMLCPFGCNINVESRRERVMNVWSPRENINEGQLCMKGRFIIPPLMNSPNRARHPMIRKNGTLQPVSWEKAIAYAAEHLMKYNGGEVGIGVSSWLTNEDAYLLQKFARGVMGTDNLLPISSMIQGVARPLAENFGFCGPTGTIEKLDTADTILIIGTDLNLSAPVLLVPTYRAKTRGATVIMIGTNTTKVPKYVDTYVSPKKYRSFFTEVMKKMEKEKENPEGDSGKVAEALKHGNTVIIFGPGLTGEDGAETVKILSDTLSQKHITVLPAWDGGNLQGILDMGAVSGILPGQHSLSSEDAKTRIEHLWNLPIAESTGKQENMKVLYLTEPVSSVPENVEFLVLHTIFDTDLAERADVVFPTTAFTEMEGTVTNLEGRVQRVTQCTNPPAMAMSPWRAITNLAEAMDASGFEYEAVSEVTDEIFQCIPEMDIGIYSRQKKKSEQLSIGEDEIPPPHGELGYGGTYLGDLVKDFDAIVSYWRSNNE